MSYYFSSGYNIAYNFLDCSAFEDNTTWKASMWRSDCTNQKNCTLFTSQTDCESYNGVCFWIDGKCSYKKEFIIEFIANGGSKCLIETKDSGETVVLPNTTRKGYMFSGWFNESTFENEWTASTTVTGDQKLYAKWTINNYTITFVYENGTVIQEGLQTYSTEMKYPDGMAPGYGVHWYSEDSELCDPATVPPQNTKFVFSPVTDFEAFCELVSLSHISWCSNCLNPCGNGCSVYCNSGKTRITSINGNSKGLTALPDSISSLKALTSL